MESCIYEGWVWHRRHAPVEHNFQNRIFLMYLDLDEVSEVFRGRWLWSASRPAIARFRRADHLGNVDQPLADCVRDLVAESGRPRPVGPVRLLTHLRYFGFVMNPVSFYYCFDRDNSSVVAIVAEVNNTPWGEQHCYVLDAEQFNPTGENRTLDKEFHVSPFMPMDLQYRWRLSAPNNTLAVNIENLRGSQQVFGVTMQLDRQEITTATLARSFVRYPLMTYRVLAGIYWQALRLWWKGCPFYPHPKHAKKSRKLVGQVTS